MSPSLYPTLRRRRRRTQICSALPDGFNNSTVSRPHGVTTVFVELPNSKIELLHPLGAESPIQPFLDRNPSGGMHHICYEVDDIYAARDHLKAQGARVLGDGEPKPGAHDKPVLFLHPKDFNGTLIELEQV